MVEKASAIWVKYYTLTNGLHMFVDTLKIKKCDFFGLIYPFLESRGGTL